MIRHIAFRTGIRVRILKKSGFFLLAGKLKNRKMLISVFVFFFVAINVLSSFVLEIDVVGNSEIPEEKIIEKLSEIDLKKFSLRSNIDVDKISVALRNGFDTIAWVGVYEKGTCLVIDIKERVKAPGIVPKNIPCNIVAKKSGVLKSLTVENGEKAVAPGQKIVKGQILISGTVPIKNSEEKRYVHSMGSAVAETEYIRENEFKLYTYEKEYTGNVRKTSEFFLMGKKIIEGSPSPYFYSDVETKRKVAGFFELNTIVYKEYVLKKTIPDKKTSENNALKEAQEELVKELGRDIIKNISHEIKYKDSETGVIRIVARCTEEIAEEKEIKICPKESSDPNQMKD